MIEDNTDQSIEIIQPFKSEPPEEFELHIEEDMLFPDKKFPDCCSRHDEQHKGIIAKLNTYLDNPTNQENINNFKLRRINTIDLAKKITLDLDYLIDMYVHMCDFVDGAVVFNNYLGHIILTYGDAIHGVQILLEQITVIIKEDHEIPMDKRDGFLRLPELLLFKRTDEINKIASIITIYFAWANLWENDVLSFKQIPDILKDTVFEILFEIHDSGESNMQGGLFLEVRSPSEILSSLKAITDKVLSLVSHRNELQKEQEKFDFSRAEYNLLMADWKHTSEKISIIEDENDVWAQILDSFSRWYTNEIEHIQKLKRLASTFNPFPDFSPVFNSKYKKEQLTKIFNWLCTKEICNKNDLGNWLSLFHGNWKNKIRWNDSPSGQGKSGNKPLLFDLIFRISGNHYRPRGLKPYFKTTQPIHQNWKNNPDIPGKLIDQLQKEVINKFIETTSC